jgi:hypothetical protein
LFALALRRLKRKERKLTPSFLSHPANQTDNNEIANRKKNPAMASQEKSSKKRMVEDARSRSRSPSVEFIGERKTGLPMFSTTGPRLRAAMAAGSSKAHKPSAAKAKFTAATAETPSSRSRNPPKSWPSSTDRHSNRFNAQPPSTTTKRPYYTRGSSIFEVPSSIERAVQRSNVVKAPGGVEPPAQSFHFPKAPGGVERAAQGSNVVKAPGGVERPAQSFYFPKAPGRVERATQDSNVVKAPDRVDRIESPGRVKRRRRTGTWRRGRLAVLCARA